MSTKERVRVKMSEKENREVAERKEKRVEPREKKEKESSERKGKIKVCFYVRESEVKRAFFADHPMIFLVSYLIPKIIMDIPTEMELVWKPKLITRL